MEGSTKERKIGDQQQDSCNYNTEVHLPSKTQNAGSDRQFIFQSKKMDANQVKKTIGLTNFKEEWVNRDVKINHRSLIQKNYKINNISPFDTAPKTRSNSQNHRPDPTEDYDILSSSVKMTAEFTHELKSSKSINSVSYIEKMSQASERDINLSWKQHPVTQLEVNNEIYSDDKSSKGEGTKEFTRNLSEILEIEPILESALEHLNAECQDDQKHTQNYQQEQFQNGELTNDKNEQKICTINHQTFVLEGEIMSKQHQIEPQIFLQSEDQSQVPAKILRNVLKEFTVINLSQREEGDQPPDQVRDEAANEEAKATKEIQLEIQIDKPSKDPAPAYPTPENQEKNQEIIISQKQTKETSLTSKAGELPLHSQSNPIPSDNRSTQDSTNQKISSLQSDGINQQNQREEQKQNLQQEIVEGNTNSIHDPIKGLVGHTCPLKESNSSSTGGKSAYNIFASENFSYLQRRNQLIWKVKRENKLNNQKDFDTFCTIVQTKFQLKIYKQNENKLIPINPGSQGAQGRQEEIMYFICDERTRKKIYEEFLPKKIQMIQVEHMDCVEHKLVQELLRYYKEGFDPQNEYFEQLKELHKDTPLKLPSFIKSHYNEGDKNIKTQLIVTYLAACFSTRAYDQYPKVNLEIERLAIVGQYALTLCVTIIAYMNNKGYWKNKHLIKEIEGIIAQKQFQASYKDWKQFKVVEPRHLPDEKSRRRSVEHCLQSVVGFLSVFIGMQAVFRFLASLNLFPEYSHLSDQEMLLRVSEKRLEFIKNESYLRLIEKLLMKKINDITEFNIEKKEDSKAYFMEKSNQIVASATGKQFDKKPQIQVLGAEDIRKVKQGYQFNNQYQLTMAFSCTSLGELLGRRIFDQKIKLTIDELNAAINEMGEDLDGEFKKRHLKLLQEKGDHFPTLMKKIILDFQSFNNDLLQTLGQSITQFALSRTFYEDSGMQNVQWHSIYQEPEKLKELTRYFSGNTYEGFSLYEHFLHTYDDKQRDRYLKQVRGGFREEEKKLNDENIPRVPVLFNIDSSQLKKNYLMHEHNCQYLIKTWGESEKNQQHSSQGISLSQLDEHLQPQPGDVAPILNDPHSNFFSLYGDVYNAIAGAMLLDSGNLDETLLHVTRMLQSRFIKYFPHQESAHEKLKKVLKLKEYLAGFNIKEQVETKKELNEEYIKIFMDNIEIRRLKFNLQQTDRLNKAFGDVQRFIEESSYQYEILLANNKEPVYNHHKFFEKSEDAPRKNFDDEIDDFTVDDSKGLYLPCAEGFREYVRNFRRHYQVSDYKRDKQILSTLCKVIGKQRKPPGEIRTFFKQHITELFEKVKGTAQCHQYSQLLQLEMKLDVPLIIELRHEIMRWKILRDSLTKSQINLMQMNPHASVDDLLKPLSDIQLRLLFQELKRASRLMINS